MHRLAVSLVLASVCLPLEAQWFDWQSPLVPRTADGRPDMEAPAPRTAEGRIDLSGLWVPADAGGSLFDDTKILGWALEAMAEAEASFYTEDPRFHCLPSGPSWLPAGASAGALSGASAGGSSWQASSPM